MCCSGQSASGQRARVKDMGLEEHGVLWGGRGEGSLGEEL